MPVKPRRRGRPPIDGYRPPFALRAFKLGLLGLTNRELAQQFEVSLATFERWISRHPDLRAAVREAREEADADVANALRKRALGMTVAETKAFLDPHTGKVKTVTYDKHIPPSEVAAMMWLTNRQRDRWRWRQTLDLTNSDASFTMFVQAIRNADQKLEAQFRVINPARLVHEEAAEDSVATPGASPEQQRR